MEKYRPLTPKTALFIAAPHTWPASVMPVIFGELYCLAAGMHISLLMAAVLLLICVLMQSGANATNDYFDFIKGTDTSHDNVEAYDSVLVFYKTNPKHVLILGLGFMAAAAALGLWIILHTGFLPLAIGVIGGVAVMLYSFGPCPISYLPIGEFVSGFVMGGLIPLGIAAAAAGALRFDILLYSVPFILGISLIMMTNNTCDIEKDIDARRNTLPALLGRSRARVVYRVIAALWIACTCVLPCIRFGLWGLISPAALLIFAAKPFLFLLTSPLSAENRVEQMKGILRANILGGAAYILTFAFSLLKI